MKSLEEIHWLEKSKNWLEAINSLEERLKNDPLEHESILRLSFLLWYLAVEASQMGHHLNTDGFSKRLNELFVNTQDEYKDDSEYLYWFGLMIHLFPWMFCLSQDCDDWEKIGKNLLKKASIGEPNNLWVIMAKRSLLHPQSEESKELKQLITRDRLEKELRGRGFLSSYYLGDLDW